MKIVKIGGSLLAPKHLQWLDSMYCTRFSTWWNAISEDKVLVHWAWNIGHGFIKQYGLTAATYLHWRRILDEMFTSLDNMMHVTRLRLEEISFLSPTFSGSFILWGDIRPDLTVSSGDVQFPLVMRATESPTWYMLTNVAGVLDKEHQIIPVITKETLWTIDFRHVHNDVTWWMRWKMQELFDRLIAPCEVWILDGQDLDNVTTVMKTGKGTWTKIVIT